MLNSEKPWPFLRFCLVVFLALCQRRRAGDGYWQVRASLSEFHASTVGKNIVSPRSCIDSRRATSSSNQIIMLCFSQNDRYLRIAADGKREKESKKTRIPVYHLGQGVFVQQQETARVSSGAPSCGASSASRTHLQVLPLRVHL